MRSLAVAVPKSKAEEVRLSLLASGLLRTGVAVTREGDTIFLPVVRETYGPYPILEREFEESFTPIRSYKDVARVPPELKPLLPTSFDVIGDIALVKIPDELKAVEREIADAILRANPAIEVVTADGGVRGALRVRALRTLAGPNRTETVHREFGLSYSVDVARAYFSPRLGTERRTVAEQVGPGEAVVDLFSGVGPYAILIARRRQPRVVYAFDANPDAVRHLEENVRRNRAERVVPRQGDALALLAGVEPPDRVIIDYPQDPGPAFSVAVSRILPGGTVHYYEILEELEREDRQRWIIETARSMDRGAEIAAVREVHGWSPSKKLFAFDVRVT
ncbi:MAG: class I SAM-dependent methyltransferase family protein [Methanobacteriota archaeon]|nr:MAG: class I SAM-dependent methyltransferase family protein [Euryarchaeota archaeon]